MRESECPLIACLSINAPRSTLCFDVDAERFADARERNAERFFGLETTDAPSEWVHVDFDSHPRAH